MQLSQEHYDRIADCFPTQRGNVTQPNLHVLNAILFVLENGSKWRLLPKEYGNWHSIYTRMNRWSKNGVLSRVFERLQRENMLHVRLDAMALDSTRVRVHPDGTGALKKTARNPSAVPAGDAQPRFIWFPRLLVRP
jgi:transposase